ncbi:MAG: ATP-binding cassette domain-containing protein [Halothiobacillaceae bacterium]
MTDEEIAVRLQGLQVGVDRPLTAAVDRTLARGSVTAVVGDNGVGKTTLLRTLDGTLAPAGGKIQRPDGLVIHHLPQHAGSGLTGPFNVADLLRLAGLESLKHPWIPDPPTPRIDRLSGGQRQRLIVACALHAPCDLLLLDEPDQYLDHLARCQLFEWLARPPLGQAVVLVTHHAELPPGADVLQLQPCSQPAEAET